MCMRNADFSADMAAAAAAAADNDASLHIASFFFHQCIACRANVVSQALTFRTVKVAW